MIGKDPTIERRWNVSHVITGIVPNDGWKIPIRLHEYEEVPPKCLCSKCMATHLSPWVSSWRFLPSNETHAVFLLSGDTVIWKKMFKESSHCLGPQRCNIYRHIYPSYRVHQTPPEDIFSAKRACFCNTLYFLSLSESWVVPIVNSGQMKILVLILYKMVRKSSISILCLVRKRNRSTVPAGFCDHPPSEGLRSLKPARPLKQESGYSDQVVAKARVWV